MDILMGDTRSFDVMIKTGKSSVAGQFDLFEAGEVGQVKERNGDDFWVTKDNKGEWFKKGDLIFPVKKEDNIMVKDKLKSGMIVECRNGRLHCVLKDVYINSRRPSIEVALFHLDTGCWVGADGFNDDLTHKTTKNLDIMRIYTPRSTTRLFDAPETLTEDAGLIWDRNVNSDSDVIMIGDVVKVIDNGQSYNNYVDWILKVIPEKAVYYSYGNYPEKGRYKVVAKHPHLDTGEMIFAIQDKKDAIYIISEKGVKLWK